MTTVIMCATSDMIRILIRTIELKPLIDIPVEGILILGTELNVRSL